MPEWLDIVLERLQVLERWDYFTLAINAFIFLTAPWLATRYGTIKNEASKNTRLRTVGGGGGGGSERAVLLCLTAAAAEAALAIPGPPYAA